MIKQNSALHNHYTIVISKQKSKDKPCFFAFQIKILHPLIRFIPAQLSKRAQNLERYGEDHSIRLV